MHARRNGHPQLLTQEQKLDEALKETFPASDPFYVAPETERAQENEEPADPSS